MLSQAAMRGHTLDEFGSGVWRPGSGAEFRTDQPSGRLVYVGQGYPVDQLNLGEHNSGGASIWYRDAGYIRELADKIESGEVPAGRIYTAAVHLRDQPSLDGVPSTL